MPPMTCLAPSIAVSASPRSRSACHFLLLISATLSAWAFFLRRSSMALLIVIFPQGPPDNTRRSAIRDLTGDNPLESPSNILERSHALHDINQHLLVNHRHSPLLPLERILEFPSCLSLGLSLAQGIDTFDS